MNINHEIKMSGKYKLDVKKGCTLSKTSGWSKNRILDNGMRLVAAQATAADGFFISTVPTAHAGSGSSAPTDSQTQLDALLGSTSSKTTTTMTANYAAGYMEVKVVYSFAIGSVVGNVSEVGVGLSATSLFSRALVLDSNGDPTTITIESDEFLELTYVLRLQMPRADEIQTVDFIIDGNPVETNITIRPICAGKSISITPQWSTFDWGMRGGTAHSIEVKNSLRMLEGSALVPATNDVPTGPATINASSGAIRPWSASSPFSRTIDFRFASSQGNKTHYLLAYCFGPGAWQVLFDPPVTKTADFSMTFTVSYTLARA